MINSDKLYFPTHTRTSPWIIGLLFGYYLHVNRGKPIKLNRLTVWLGWIISLGLIFTCLFHGIRCMSLIWVIYGHDYVVSALSPNINVVDVLPVSNKDYLSIVFSKFWQIFRRIQRLANTENRKLVNRKPKLGNV